jgi:SAM-dependent methyltransferase
VTQPLDAAKRYLDVRYSERERPYTDYPSQLTAHLTERYLSDHRGGKLLDLGCGRGEFLHGFAELGFAAVGFDRSRPAQPRFSEPVVVGDYERAGLPFSDAQFSVLFNKSVFEHVRDISPLLRECHRVLGPGGRMLTLVPDWMAQWRHFYDDWTHVRPFTLVGLRECIQSHGFEVREALRFRQLPLLWQRPYLSPLSDAAALLPNAFKRSKFVRFSKEWMLLVVADRIG